MTLRVVHSTVTGAPADPTALVDGVAWDAEHVLTQATGALLGRTTAGDGSTEEIAVGAGLLLADGELKLRDFISVTDYGAKGDTVVKFDGAISSSSTAFSSASASFSSSDVGKLIRIVGAGAAGAVLETTIAARVSATAVTLTATASTTVTGAQFFYGSDDTAAIQSALTAAGNDYVRLYIPSRMYMTSSALTVTAFTLLSVIGEGSTVGPLGSAIIPSITSNGIVVNSLGAVYLEKIAIIYPGPANAGTAGLILWAATEFNQYSRLRDVGVVNPYNGVITFNHAGSVIDGLHVDNFSNAGIIYGSDLNGGDTGDNRLVNSLIWGAVTGAPLVGVYWSGGGGLTAIGNKFARCATGVQVNPASGIATSQISIIGNSFDGVTDYSIRYSRQPGGLTLSEFNVLGNTFNIYNGTASWFLADVDGSGGAPLDTLSIVANTGYGSPSGGTLINVNSADNVIVSGNAFRSQNASTVGIAIGSTVTNAVIGPNSFSGTFANQWTNASASFKVANAITPVTNGILVSGASSVSALATANSGILKTSGSGVPSIDNQAIPSLTIGANTAPDSLLNLNANTGAPVAPANSGGLHQIGADGATSVVTIDSYTNGSTGTVQSLIQGRQSGGTQASKSATVLGQIYLHMQGMGWDGSAYAVGSSIQLRATETWSGSAHGGEVALRTVTNGATSASDRVVVKNSGGVTVGSGVTDPGNGSLALAAAIQVGSFTVATLPAGVNGQQVYCSNARMFDGAGVKEGAGAGTGGMVTYNGAWKIAGTNSTAVA